MSGIFDQIINYSPPLIVSGTVNYKGTWNASTNNPTLNSSPAASTKGDYYVVSTAGTQFGITFAIGDWIISNGTAWEKVDLTDAVSSVFGRTGAVVGVSTDYSSVGITNTAIGASSPSTGAFTTVTASSTIAATGAVTGSNLSGTNTGDQTTITGNAGSATVLQIPRAIYGNSFDGSAALTQVIASTYGGTGNGFAKFSGPASSEKTFTLPNANATLLYDGGALGTPASGTVTNLTGTASININGTVGATTANTGLFTTIGASGSVLQDYNGGGGNSFTARYNSSNPRGGVYVQGGSGKVFFGENLVHSTANVFVADKAGTAWALADSGGSNVGLFYATGLTAGATAFDFSTTTGRILSVSSTGLAVTGALSSTTGATFATSSGNLLVGTSSGSYSTISKSSAGNFVLEVQNTSATSPSVLNLKYTATSGGAGDFIQCNDNVGLKFIVNASGAVGIGTASPALKLDATFSSAGDGIRVYNTLSTGFADVRIGNNSNNNLAYLRVGGSAQGGISQDALVIGTGGGYPIKIAPQNAVTATFDVSGNVGIGTSSPGAFLTLSKNSDIAIRFDTTDGTATARNWAISSSRNAYGDLAIMQSNALGGNPLGAGTARMYFQQDGLVGIGTTSPAGALHVYGANANVHIGSSTSGTAGLLTFSEATTPAWQIGAPSGANSYFNIKDSYNNVDRLRITQAGNLLVGTTTVGYGLFTSSRVTLGNGGAGDGFCVGGINEQLSAYTVQANNNTGTRYAMYIANGSSTAVGTISFTSTLVSYNVTSDYRKKSNIKDLTESGAFIDALKPRTFDWYTGDKGVGFIAHEFAEVCPSAVTGEKDAVDSNGKPIYQSMQASTPEVIANLVAELQSVRQRLAALEA
ncbi:Intramolecular chaperone auto-processing domain containing protein [uncultured Caudovirales phage]|uniref:Intramolecular chaperone auto-processing domain containing protein n=1 Tax=uncultured Caudovirales phage TaxID=2100421 RepID=A0A6J5MX36_9CAUD|nr:Intramolecular chaperone auto-processing domain containing protein [uncultured Caudovirales phage]